MITQHLPGWLELFKIGQMDIATVHAVVLLPVFEFLSQPPAHLNFVARRHRNVAKVKKSMDILAQEDAVRG